MANSGGDNFMDPNDDYSEKNFVVRQLNGDKHHYVKGKLAKVEKHVPKAKAEERAPAPAKKDAQQPPPKGLAAWSKSKPGKGTDEE